MNYRVVSVGLLLFVMQMSSAKLIADDGRRVVAIWIDPRLEFYFSRDDKDPWEKRLPAFREFTVQPIVSKAFPKSDPAPTLVLHFFVGKTGSSVQGTNLVVQGPGVNAPVNMARATAELRYELLMPEAKRPSLVSGSIVQSGNDGLLKQPGVSFIPELAPGIARANPNIAVDDALTSALGSFFSNHADIIGQKMVQRVGFHTDPGKSVIKVSVKNIYDLDVRGQLDFAQRRIFGIDKTEQVELKSGEAKDFEVEYATTARGKQQRAEAQARLDNFYVRFSELTLGTR